MLVAAIVGCTERRIADATAPAMTEKSVADQAEAVRRGESVQIRLDHTKVVDADLLHLNDLGDKLERINLSNGDLTNLGLERISRLSHLMQLRVRSPRITDEGVVHLQRLKQLRHLHLIDVPLTDVGIALLYPLTGLDSLYLDGTHATDAALQKLKRSLPGAHLHVDGGHQRSGPPDSEPLHKH